MKALGLIALLASWGCAARPAYFGSAARVAREKGGAYWEAPALAPSYLQARMLRPRRAPAAAPAVYEGTLTLRSASSAVLRSSFSVAEGGSASFRYELNPRGAADRYEPGTLDVVVFCGHGACRASSKPLPISADGQVALKKRPRRRTDRRAASVKAADAGALAAAQALRKDGECAALDEAVAGAAARTARTGEAETRSERAARSRYLADGCSAWLGERGGVGAARRRVRLSQWTSLGGE
jgi:hypothetical protein